MLTQGYSAPMSTNGPTCNTGRRWGASKKKNDALASQPAGQAGRQADRQTGRQTDRQAGRQTGSRQDGGTHTFLRFGQFFDGRIRPLDAGLKACRIDPHLLQGLLLRRLDVACGLACCLFRPRVHSAEGIIHGPLEASDGQTDSGIHC